MTTDNLTVPMHMDILYYYAWCGMSLPNISRWLGVELSVVRYAINNTLSPRPKPKRLHVLAHVHSGMGGYKRERLTDKERATVLHMRYVRRYTVLDIANETGLKHQTIIGVLENVGEQDKLEVRRCAIV